MIGPQRIAEALGLHPPTPEQSAVIGAPAEPALVVAGAGAGKTETMAARVVWLVANGLVTPERVLGLTFTRKAARQLADRVRARLRRLAGSGLLEEVDPSGGLRSRVLAGEPTVLTYHAYAGRLVGEHGLRVPVEPGARLLTETAAWQLAHSVVSSWTEDLDTDRVPSTVTGYVLSLASELAEHLVAPEQVAEHAERMCRIVESAPAGKGQRAALSQELQKIPAAQRLRAALLPLLDEYGCRKRREAAMDFADQMSLAARLADEHPEVAAGERERFGAVLLDEYQDTGHAQRVLLRALFGGARAPLPVTAVGDPAQAIYGWRGASAANLPRFATDFPRRVSADSDVPGASTRGDGSDRDHSSAAGVAPAERYGLMTSFRNPPEVLHLANVLSGPLREAGLEVEELRARDGAGPGDIRCALVDDVRSERDWVADHVAQRWQETLHSTGEPPTAAVLVRRRADMADLAAALRERGLPVEVVGLGGLLEEPEVRDLVSALRVLVDPLAGTAAMRLLTGARWRIGAADLAALWERARELGTRAGTPEPEGATAAVAEALPGENAEQAGLVDALDDPGEPERYSREGFRRMRRLGKELAALRQRLEQPLPELVADVERTLLLDIESLARPGGAGRAHLDALSAVVNEFATASPSATLPALLDYLDSAERAEDGLEPGEVEVAEDRVQVLTAHAAKGLEWQVVAVPHLVDGVFPGKRRSSCWLRSVTELPAELRGDAQDLPRLDLERLEGMDRKEITVELDRHDEDFEERRLTEERRLLYVASTRSERTLLVSGHWWGETGTKPKGPSGFLRELAEALGGDPAAGVVEHWAPHPDGDTANPLTEAARGLEWPADPLGERRGAVEAGADLVRAALTGPQSGAGDGRLSEKVPAAQGAESPESGAQAPEDDETARWARDVDVLLAERDATARRDEVTLPDHLSVSRLVELADDRQALARRLRRPLPQPPNPAARRGTAFHAWLEHRFTSTALLDIDELPGAADDSATSDGALEELREAFLASSWADRTPYRVEVPFETRIDGIAIRGRMDAVFADPDGGWTVVDWKTGAVPGEDRTSALSVQLAAYRLAWSELSGVPLSDVRAAFHYVRHDRTLRPVDLLDAEGLRALLASVPEAE
ncbi:DNA helicase-2/ATP-dependent DNA helicase PcrA [Halopolyspora algeriensis]|uniref:DNA 3'-5' helicase n=1 Tax=Halopolyspora algeriensis TaxID=1500506 RepID=A0A368VTQ3_9ACTN|nr:UvrD-helicase domain-containing protein [Halopolyspora algeriensis]RCW42833.1 DNA helicase-2/ATP-dependent DNA helicase PcrA [Halopolyspora algeriensis]TQM56697.1 DNA helicase-2/ATP-dependent DNA helicase PcrA [Halopolyspora algeriensis]